MSGFFTVLQTEEVGLDSPDVLNSGGRKQISGGIGTLSQLSATVFSMLAYNQVMRQFGLENGKNDVRL